MKQILLDETYVPEDLSDVERDVSECFDDAEESKDGYYRVVVSWNFNEGKVTKEHICANCEKVFQVKPQDEIRERNSDNYFCNWKCWTEYLRRN
jgi:hypothetical protein